MSSLTRLGTVLRAGGRFLGNGARRRTGERHSGGEPRYREFPEVTKKQVFDSEFLSGAMWFWILWHFWHDPDAVLGHFPYPDSSKWTDEELGIPPDNEEEEK